MIELEHSAIANTIVQSLAEVESSDTVLVITDPKRSSVGQSITVAVRATGACATLAIMPEMETHGNEPPAPIPESMKAVDIVFTTTTHSLTHTGACRAANAAGTQVVVMRGVTEEMLINGGLNTDYENLERVTREICESIEDADTATVTSPAGTNIEINLHGNSPLIVDGKFHGNGFSVLPAGEAPICPTKSGTSGQIVIDYSMDGIGQLESPIELTIHDGTVTGIDGGLEATQLQDIVNSSDDRATNLAEFSIGTNPDARLIGNLAEDKKQRGTVHFAIGDDRSLGGSIQSDIHLDGVVLDPTVVVDGDPIVERGQLLETPAVDSE